ncbi:MAG: helix-turn-helix domain-containing protein, partial [Calditrichaceae bacterium]
LITEELIGRFNHELNKNIIRINQDCLSALEEYDWPGNVRELINVLQRAVLVCQGDEIQIEHLPRRFQHKADESSKFVIEIGKTLNEVEKQLIHRTLTHTKNNRKKAAELLGITRRALYNKLHKHNLI